MTIQTKYLVFKGIAKKEEILFKSFLNLAKNELPYEVVISDVNCGDQYEPDIVIQDENYQFNSEEQYLDDLPKLMVGDDLDKQNNNYINRPVQWSEFKIAFTALNVIPEEQDNSVQGIASDEVVFELVSSDETITISEEVIESDSQQTQETETTGYELDNLSVNYESFTSSDYVKVVDDVKQFAKMEGDVQGEPVILVTDEESTSTNSVLVIETNSLDAWDLEDSEFSISNAIDKQQQNEYEESETEEVVLKQRVGFDIEPDEEYWLEDNEIVVENESLLFIKTARNMVYSPYEPGKWPAKLSSATPSKLPLQGNWRPTQELEAYSLDNLIWVHILVTKTTSLEPDLDEDQEYLLESWPNFDLLEFDNVLLKLCTMLYVRPESLSSLITKSGYERSIVCGLMNACHYIGHLKALDEMDVSQLVSLGDEGVGVLDKIKDVFK